MCLTPSLAPMRFFLCLSPDKHLVQHAPCRLRKALVSEGEGRVRWGGRVRQEHLLEASDILSETQAEAPGARWGPEGFRSVQDVALYAMYALALAVSISTWFIAIRAPLWLDETISVFVIKGGFSEILSRQGWPGVPAYSYLLWLWTKAMGWGEITLRTSSILTMLGAVFLLYRSARQLFGWDSAMVAAVIFCLHPVVFVESIDVRPYAFAVLAINSSILALVHLRHNNSNWLAALFGLSAACIVYFHFLFVVILPALAICFFALKIGPHRTQWRQLGIALGVFALAFLPVLPGLQYMFHTSGIHVFDDPPTLAELGQVLAQEPPAAVLAVTLLIAAATRRLDLQSPLKASTGFADPRGLETRPPWKSRALRQISVAVLPTAPNTMRLNRVPVSYQAWPILLCTSLALVPILILYAVSAETSLHIFVFRYWLVAIPGVALCWALAVSRINSRALRLMLCMAVVAVTAYHYFSSPSSKIHNYTWKYALEFIEKNASATATPVLICSDLPESDYMPMPAASAVKDSVIFAQLSYYQVSLPVVALPRSLNDEAMQIGSQFLQQAAQRHERFLALAFEPSYDTLDWLATNSAATHNVRELGVFDGVKVLEFVPRT